MSPYLVLEVVVSWENFLRYQVIQCQSEAPTEGQRESLQGSWSTRVGGLLSMEAGVSAEQRNQSEGRAREPSAGWLGSVRVCPQPS